MTVALISGSPGTYLFVEAYPAVPNPLALPNGEQVEGASVGWADNGYALVAVTPFAIPAGYITTGNPSYLINDNTGAVSESYETIPTPPVTWIPAATFIERFTDAEYIAIRAAVQAQMQAGNAQLAKWIDRATAEGGIDVSSDEVKAAKAALVAAGLLTSQRADIVFATL